MKRFIENVHRSTLSYPNVQFLNKKKKNTTLLKQTQNYNRKIVAPNTHDRSLNWLDAGTSITRGNVK
jgi:hypothetical protein